MDQVNFRIGWGLLVALTVLGTLAFWWSTPLGFALLGIAAIYLGTCLHEVKDPDVAMLFRMGRLVGRLDPGWYLTIPHLWEIETIPTSWQQLPIEGEMYTKEKTPIVVKARMFWRADESRLTDILRMRPKEMISRAETAGLAVLRGEIGNNEFTTLVSEKGTLEVSALTRLQGDFQDYGYAIRDFEIYDFDEKTWSEAERIKTIGKARGEAARALAEPLRGNYPAAIVSAVGTFTETAGEVAKSVWGRNKKEKKESGEAGSAPQKEDIGQKLAAAINRLIGG